MTGKTLDILDVLIPDQLASTIANQYVEWDMYRQQWLAEKREIQSYVFATDTTKTSNAKLPWSNKTTIPKLCQIRDNLSANYMASMFPKRKWLQWEGATPVDEDQDKKDAIESYMAWVVDRNEFYDEILKLVLDYIDYGNAIATVEWVDRRSTVPANSREYGSAPREQVGYVGPVVRRINPVDITINPTAPSFVEAPKIVRSLVSIGEVKEMLDRDFVSPEEAKIAKDLFDYMKDIRRAFLEHQGSVESKDEIYNVAGFSNWTDYMGSTYCEILTFYGDIYDEDKDTFLRNHIVQIVDRHKILCKKPNPSYFGQAPIYHAGWRLRADNLWAMGPLDNLVGMQYRIDHLENMKADIFDLIAYPPLKVKGYVEDFEWGPFERIYVGDEGDVELLSPDVAALQADNQIAILEAKMEEMAGSPKEAMGFRTPGEKTKYEVQRLENAASRIFQHKIGQFERSMTEQLLNAMLELARRNMDRADIRAFDDELKIATFSSLSLEDITGNGRIKPVAARHFAEKAQQVQDLSNFRQSVAGQDPALLAHFSTVNEAKLWEYLLDLEDYNIIQPYIRMTEQRDAQMMMNVNEEQMAMETMTPSGLSPEDVPEEQI
jgi:hypothetical protein